MTSNLSTSPLEGCFCKSFEALIKILGLLLVVNSECCYSSTLMRVPPVLMSDTIVCKLSKLGLTKIRSQNTFPPIFFSFLPYFWYPLNTEKGMCILAFSSLYENTISWLFHEKWFHILVEAFKMLNWNLPTCQMHAVTHNICLLIYNPWTQWHRFIWYHHWQSLIFQHTLFIICHCVRYTWSPITYVCWQVSQYAGAPSGLSWTSWRL